MARAPRTDAAPARADTGIPESFRVTLSSGGGFAGLYQGYILSPDSVRAFRQRGAAPPEELWARSADPDSLRAFVRDLRAYSGDQAGESGNMTTRIVLADSAGERTWSMAGMPAQADAPGPFKSWYSRAEAYCRSLAPAP